jgi:hypothetical protein
MNTLSKFTLEDLKALSPCADAYKFAVKCKTVRKAWDTCPRADWLLWLLARVQPLSRKQAVTFACQCAMQVLPVFEKRFPDDNRPRLAIKAAQAFLVDPSDKNKQAAAAEAAAWAAAASAEAWAEAAAAAAAEPAAWAAWAAWVAAASAEAAAAAAAAAAEEAAWAAAWAAWAASVAERKAQADILRSIIPNPFSTQPKPK